MAFDVKNTTFFWPLELLAPHSCRGCGALGSVLCARCKKYNILREIKLCSRCGKDYKTCSCSVPVYTAFYREGVPYQLLEDYKFNSVRAAAPVLAEFLDAAIPKDLRNAVIVPLPTISKHVRSHGFDHTLLLAKKLARRREGFSVEKLLSRHANTIQVGASEKTRKIQAARAYQLAPSKEVIASKTYLLLDDVWTTGASMEAAITVMKKAGAKNLASAVLLTSR